MLPVTCQLAIREESFRYSFQMQPEAFDHQSGTSQVKLFFRADTIIVWEKKKEKKKEIRSLALPLRTNKINTDSESLYHVHLH